MDARPVAIWEKQRQWFRDSHFHIRGQRGNPRKAWEEPLVRSLGPDWKKIAGRCSWKEWKDSTDQAIDMLLKTWDLVPQGRKQKTAQGEETKKTPQDKHRDQDCKAESVLDLLEQGTHDPESLLEELGFEPDPGEGDFNDTGIPGFIASTDNQLCSGVLNGEMEVPMLERPIFVRIINNIEDIIAAGRGLSHASRSWARWSPRKYNTLPDLLCHHAMRYKASFSWQGWDDVDRGAHVTLRSDGGYKDGCGAAGWIIYAGVGAAKRLVACGCQYMEGLRHATHAEAIALEMAFRHLKTLEGDHDSARWTCSTEQAPAGLVEVLSATTR